MLATRIVALSAAALLAASASTQAQVRVANWNITNWTASNVSTRGAAFQTSFYGVVPAGLLYAGKQFAPDVLIAEEITQGGTPTAYPIASAYQTTGQNNVDAFVNLLNTASGSPGDWAAAPYVPNQGDTGNALFYRTSRVQLIDTTTLGCGFSNAPCGAGGATIDVGSGTTQSPRDNQRWRVRLIGYGPGAGSELYLYGGHLKASDGSAEQARKMPEATRVRNDAALLPSGANYIFGADFNVQTSARNYYQVLVGSGTGQFFDPINKPGAWNTDCGFRNIHTQEPTSAASGGMDDRHDQLLISSALRDGQGLSYIPYTPGGNILAAFVNPPSGCNNSGTVAQQNTNPTSTAWFDANHSYRCWGNDGNHYNIGIAETTTTPTNTMVGQTIAQALVTTCAGNGHLPVYLDLQVPSKLGAPTGTIDLGTVAQNSSASYTLQITNAADVARYSKDGTGWGIDGLTYSLAISAGPFAISGGTGPFERAASLPATPNSHTITLDTSTSGSKNCTVTITSDDPDNPTRVFSIIATVQSAAPTGACCPGAGQCTVTTAAGCSVPGSWGNGVACQPNPCPPLGACCSVTTGLCTTMVQATCSDWWYAAVCQPNPCPGACCSAASGACTVLSQTSCPSGSTYTSTASCSPNTCPQPTGACCTVTICSITASDGCIGAFQGVGVACSPPGNPIVCCPANFNQADGLTVADIFDFLNAWFAGVPATDFNHNGQLEVSDIFNFLNAWFAGC